MDFASLSPKTKKKRIHEFKEKFQQTKQEFDEEMKKLGMNFHTTLVMQDENGEEKVRVGDEKDKKELNAGERCENVFLFFFVIFHIKSNKILFIKLWFVYENQNDRKKLGNTVNSIKNRGKIPILVHSKKIFEKRKGIFSIFFKFFSF